MQQILYDCYYVPHLAIRLLLFLDWKILLHMFSNSFYMLKWHVYSRNLQELDISRH